MRNLGGKVLKLKVRLVIVGIWLCGVVGCTAASGQTDSAADIQRKQDLAVAETALSTKKSERDAAVAHELAFEDDAVKGAAEMAAMAAESKTVDDIVTSWGDDYLANIRDITPTSIEGMVQQSTKFMKDLDGIPVADTLPSYQSAAAKYVDACGALADAEKLRLKIIYSHTGALLEDDKIQNENDRQYFEGNDVGDWVRQGGDVNDLIQKAVSDIASTKEDMSKEQDAAPDEVVTQIKEQKTQIESLSQEVVAAEDRVRSLGGTP